MAGAFRVQLLFTFFFMPKTAYKRSGDSGIPIDSPIDKLPTADNEKEYISQLENSASISENTSIPG